VADESSGLDVVNGNGKSGFGIVGIWYLDDGCYRGWLRKGGPLDRYLLELVARLSSYF